MLKLYVLRHEERDLHDPSFNIHLTTNGKERANGVLKEELEKLNITHVYTSPFIRCLQTIHPYCKSRGIKPMVDYSLYEYLDHRIFRYQTARRTLYTTEQYHYEVDLNYKSVYKTPPVCMPIETSDEVKGRVKEFVGTHLLTDTGIEKTVLLCTHQAIVEMLLEEFHGTKPDGSYPMGLVSPLSCPGSGGSADLSLNPLSY